MTTEEKAAEITSRLGIFDSYNVKLSALAMAEWKDQQISEEINLIIDWFKHIAQIADDRKTANGYVMQDSDALDEIKCLAKSSAEHVEEFLKK